MIALISGVIVTGAGGAGLWYFMPHHGKVNRYANMPFLDSMIPIGIVSALAVGVAMIVAGAMG